VAPNVCTGGSCGKKGNGARAPPREMLERLL
jgi:hypothetical protein